jgi:hypothetical protein
VIFFTDRNLGHHFPSILRDAGLSVEHHDKHFGENTRDEEWLEFVGARGWIAITRDARIRYKPNERAAVIHHRVALLVLIGTAPFPELARSFLASRSRIERFAQSHSPPYVAKLYRPSTTERAKRPDAPGRVELWYSESWS